MVNSLAQLRFFVVASLSVFEAAASQCVERRDQNEYLSTGKIRRENSVRWKCLTV
jgi:hypothetical protein